MLFDSLPLGSYDAVTFEFFSDIENGTIWFKDFGLYFVEENKTGYFINIDTSYSEFTTTLIPNLYHQGIIIEDEEIKWTWYEYTFNLDNKQWSWNDLEATTKDLQIEESSNTWKNKILKAKAELSNKSEFFSSEIKVSNKSNTSNYSIKEENNSFILYREAEAINTTDSFGYWTFSGENGTIIKEIEGEQNFNPFENSKTYTKGKITCIYFISKTNGQGESIKELVDTVTYDYDKTIFFSENFSVQASGTDWFNYKNTGELNAAIDLFYLSVPKVLNFNGKDYIIEEGRWTWKDTGKTELDNSNNMISEIIESNETEEYKIKFRVKSRYNYENSLDNYFTFTYKCDDQYFSQKFPLRFLLNGQTGTNGTGWYGGIEEIEENGEIIYKVEVYKDGILVPQDSGEYVINIESHRCNYKFKNNNYNYIIITETTGYFSYFKISVKITNKPNSNFYIYHPVVHDENNKPIILNTNIPKVIMYDTNGYHPDWSSNTTIKINDKDISTKIDTNKRDDPPLYNLLNGKIIPKEKFIGGENIVDYVRYVLEVDSENKPTKYYIIPIIFIINRYGNENINGWDGQELVIKTDENNNKTTLLAPTIGAGRKNGDGSFSGVVMGVDPQQENLTGLYGYKNGGCTFSLTEDGNAYFNGNGHFNGTVEANDGYIGSLYLSNGKLFGLANKDNSWVNGLNGHYENAVNSTIFLWAGAKGGEGVLQEETLETFGKREWGEAKKIIEDSAPFYVTHDGQLHSSAGSIAGWDIKETSIEKTYNGYTSGIKMPGSGTYGLALGASNSEHWVTAPFRVTHAGMVSVKGTIEIENQSWNPNGDNSGYATGQIGWGYGSSDETQTTGPIIKRDDSHYVIITNKGVRMTAGTQSSGSIFISDESGDSSGAILTKAITLGIDSSSTGALYGTWKLNGSTTVVSDINKKHSVNSLTSQYSTLFDNLHPVTYKYNDGTSDRLHTGFIAQEVKEALDTANIDTQNFAGLVVWEPGTEEELWTLRYEEFIALNTNEIQKAKKRIYELEARVSQLENLLQVNSN